MIAAAPVKELPPENSEKNSLHTLYNQVLKVVISLSPLAGFNVVEVEITGASLLFICILLFKPIGHAYNLI